MAVLKILTYPDPFLKKIAEPIQIHDGSLEELSANMIETMYAFKGIGLAATQIGVNKRIFVIDVQYRPDNPESQPRPTVFINPKIMETSDEVHFEEGCLSVPEFRAKVTRHATVVLAYTDLNQKRCRIKADGLKSICIQHELDHLDGKVFIDRLSPLKRAIIQNKLKKRKHC